MNNKKDSYLELKNKLVSIKNNEVVKAFDKKLVSLKESLDPKLRGTMKIRFKEGQEESSLYVKFDKSIPDNIVIVKGTGPISQRSVQEQKEEIMKVRIVLMESISSTKNRNQKNLKNREKRIEQLVQRENHKIVPFQTRAKVRIKKPETSK